MDSVPRPPTGTLSESRYQTEARALRNAMERGIGALLEARRACAEEHTRQSIEATVWLMREIAAIDFDCPVQRAAYRPPGGCP